RLGDRAEDDADLLYLALEGRRHRDAVEDRIDGDAGQDLLLPKRNAELLVGLEELGIDLAQALGTLLRLGCGIVIVLLIVDRRIAHERPARLRHGEPVPEGLEPPRDEPLGLAFLRGDEADGVLGETLGRALLLDIGHEAVLVLALGDRAELLDRICGTCHCTLLPGFLLSAPSRLSSAPLRVPPCASPRRRRAEGITPEPPTRQV